MLRRGAKNPQRQALNRRHKSVSANLLTPNLQRLFHQSHKLVGNSTVDEAVVVAKGQVNDGANRDGIVAFLVGDHEGLLGDSAHAHNGGVWLINNRQTKDSAELARIGDGEGGTFDVLGLELFIAGALAKIGDAALQAEEIEVAGILEHGYDESPVKSDGDADVDVTVIAEVFTLDRSVDDWPLLDRDNRGTHEERHEGEANSVALLESVLMFGAQGDDASEIHFVHAVDMGTGPP